MDSVIPPPKDSAKDPKRKTPPPGSGNLPPIWRGLLWYIPVLLLLLWFWQDLFSSMRVQTIPYSQFKQYLAQGEVKDCDVETDEILGTIVPKAESAPSKTGQTPEAKSATAQQQTPVKETPVKETPAPEKESAMKQVAEKQPTEKQPPEKQPVEKSPSKSAAAPPANATAQATPAQPVPAKPPASAKSKSVATETKSVPPPSDKAFKFRTIRVEDPQLVDQLEAAHVEFNGVRPSLLATLLWAWVLPIIFFGAIWYFLSRRMGMAGQAVMSIGKSKAKLVADKDTGVGFDDVAGCDEAKYELQEVVDFLKNPQRYEALGAKIPKGILLVGPPGTGKTLLSRAVAGEAHVPFFSISGSEFVEMFVGVGAARVRDLFEQAKKHAPCIIFIDEIDAIGGQRSIHMGPVNDEREQTLNQLLAEMDGFEANIGVIILAATNRPEILDRALLRPGRFDRQVVVDAPDVDGREAILKVHARDKRLAPDINLRKIAQATAGFSGADLANALNEAALLAARRRAPEITQRDVEDAVEKVVAGPERRSRRLEPEQKRRVAYHEVGHALVAAYSEHADPVHKISIVPRGRAALGYTLQLPTEEQFLMTRSELVDRIKGMLGGRSAEEVVYGEISTGAENDLEHATALARQMVCMYGMSDRVGLVHVANRQDGYLPTFPGAPTQRDCSEETIREIDIEVKKLLDDAHDDARAILNEHRDQLELVAQELLKRETLDATAFNELIGQHRGSDTTEPAPALPVAP
ncbi:MAG TPA: ATP-dependent zinc metalloprotease FtsH [Planctomycetaceae bacterium]|jgi:cell division protease FtsH|nr:ATP-dependent zinc metalloprotease FtsH [Planctomycetaceae bacterium]